MAENLEQLPALKEGQQVIMPIDQPIKSSGHIQVSCKATHSAIQRRQTCHGFIYMSSHVLVRLCESADHAHQV